MLVLTMSKPNTLGETSRTIYGNYDAAKFHIEARCGQLTRCGWEMSEQSGSSSQSGMIEFSHDDAADVWRMRWFTPQGQCYECGDTWDLDELEMNKVFSSPQHKRSIVCQDCRGAA